MPLTKKCKKISESRCSPHEGAMSPECELSPKNRCVLIKKVKPVTKKKPAAKKECPPGKILNPKTNRCIKDPSLSKTEKSKTAKKTTKTAKSATKHNKLSDVLEHTITINGHGGFNKKKIKVPNGFQVLIPHENGLESDYTTPDAGKNKLFEEDLYNKHYFNYRFGWKLYLPGDSINNLKLSSFSDSSSCKDIKQRHLIQKPLIEKCFDGKHFNSFCPLFCTTVDQKKNVHTHLKYKNKSKLKIKSCNDFLLSDLFENLKPMISHIPSNIRDTISPGKDDTIVLIPFTCNAKIGNPYIDEGMHISNLDNFSLFQIDKKGNRLINEKNTYVLNGMAPDIPNPKLKITSDNKWICNKCTFHNELKFNNCQMCFVSKPYPITRLTYVNLNNKNDIVYLWNNNGTYYISTENNFGNSMKVVLETNNFFNYNDHTKLQTIYDTLYDIH